VRAYTRTHDARAHVRASVARARIGDPILHVAMRIDAAYVHSL
jgi:hypothetical protein